MMTPFQAGEMFLALRLHFTRPSYDYFKYHGKTTMTPEIFALRSDKFLFAKLVRTYTDEIQFRDFVVANCLHDQHLHSRMLMTPEARDRYLDYRKTHESLTYLVEQDCHTLKDRYPELKEMLRVSQTYPPLLTAVWQHTIHLETMLILNRVLNFLPMWEQRITDTIKWPASLLLWKKYDPFISIEIERFRRLFRSVLTAHTYS